MAEKSIPEKITDDFIEKITEYKIFDEKQLESLKSFMDSEDTKKDNIVDLIKEAIKK